MAMVVYAPEPNTKISKPITLPSYLNNVEEESFEFEITKPIPRRVLNNPFVPVTNKAASASAAAAVAEDEEIDVFSAEKYFNEEEEGEGEYSRDAGKDAPKLDHHPKKDIERVDHVLDPEKPKIRPRTPSVRSESSWNSRTMLLQKIPTKHHQQQHRNSIRVRGKRFFTSIGCSYCSCRDKNSLDVEEKTGEEIKPTLNNRENKNLPPVFYPKLENQENDETNRKSLEVFGSPVLEKQRRLTMVAWDAIAPRSETENPLNSNIDYETGSEASSDLFEIESFPGNSNIYSSTGYAPSEASIEWSVVTASAADFSVASDTEDPRTISSPSFHRSFKNGREFISKDKPKRLPSILLGCKSQKAVGVVSDVYRTMNERDRKHQSSEPFMPLTTTSATTATRFHAESKFAGYGVRHHAGSFSASIFNRESHVLYI